ncbi:MAG: N-6 DNA methylase, partial [Bacteroidia bacterium]|nr:N-6 DNA methylase [Bacteroidia bacterium]
MNLLLFHRSNLFDACLDLFKQLNVEIHQTTAQPVPVEMVFKHRYSDFSPILEPIKDLFIIGIIKDQIFQQTSLFDTTIIDPTLLLQQNEKYEGIFVLALELNKYPSRKEIANLARAFNQIAEQVPVLLLLRYMHEGNTFLSMAITERLQYLQSWRAGEKIGKVAILRDINVQNPHAGHIRILQDLVKPNNISTFAQLHTHWNQVLSTETLNKKFFQELSDWYFAALEHISFPTDLSQDTQNANAVHLIRLITRLIFVWFLKEKQLVPEFLFNPQFLNSILKDFNKNRQSSIYYNAILQNLFFATLNQKMDERKFAKQAHLNVNKEHYGVKNLYRYADLFTIPEDKVLQLFKDIPFLNGGLFDCLDKMNSEGKVIYVDGFSRNPAKRAKVPDFLFFEPEWQADLSSYYGQSAVRKVKGLIPLLQSYKFTVIENTPIEEEIALDPELLGKVFENLLANYNPETQTTARKQTGSFYTPREIVDYMVDATLFQYLKQQFEPDAPQLDQRLYQLLSFKPIPNDLFQESEIIRIVQAIDNCKIIDPACGSGAFLMGVLLKLVHILQKIDPSNKHWKELQSQKALNELKHVFSLDNKELRDQRMAEINDIFENNTNDYGRKLYLIQNCIYGVDIQPIAVQIAKLRFFISLIIDQKTKPDQENLGIRSLPNLETKFIAADFLLPLHKPTQTQLRNPIIEQKENQLKQIRLKYFGATTRKQKLDLQQQDQALRQEIKQLLEKDNWNTESAQKIAQFDPYDQNTSNDWFDPEWMFGLNAGFDIVIGNPPYIQLQKEQGKLAQRYQAKKDKKTNAIIFEYKTFERTGDIYTLFYERGIQLLKPNGLLCYITSNKWMRAGYGQKLRSFFTQFNPILLIDLGPGVFESATVDTNILLIQNHKPQKFHLLALNLQKTDAQTIHQQVQQNAVVLNTLTKDAWFIGSSVEQRLKQKIENIGKPLKNWDINIYYGIKTGLNEAFIITTAQREAILDQCKTQEERERTQSIIKPILRGRDIKRYYYEWAELW